MAGSERNPVIIPSNVYAGLEEVRKSGLTNMLDVGRVIGLCRAFGHTKAAKWVQSNRDLYAEGIFRGFKPHDEGSSRGGRR